MSTATAFPSMGATLFFGMTFVVLITQGEPETEFANPQKTMAQTDLPATPRAVVRTAQASWPTPFRLPDAILDRKRADAPVLNDNTDTPWTQVTRAQTVPTLLPDVVQTEITQADETVAVAVGAIQRPETQPHAWSFPRAALRDRQVQSIGPAAAIPGVLLALGPPAQIAQAQTLDLRVTQSIPWTPAPGRTTRPDDATQETRPQITTDSTGPSAAQSQITALVPSDSGDMPAVTTTPIGTVSRGAVPGGLGADLTPSRLPNVPTSALPARVVGDSVFLRTAPQANARTLGQFDTDTAATLHEVRGDWRRVTIQDQTGWMFFRFLDPDTLE